MKTKRPKLPMPRRRLALLWLLAPCLVLLALPLLAIRQSRGFRLGAGLAMGGGLSNLLERILHGQVFDYVQFPRLPGKPGRLVFNLADFALALGGVLMVLFSGRRR